MYFSTATVNVVKLSLRSGAINLSNSLVVLVVVVGVSYNSLYALSTWTKVSHNYGTSNSICWTHSYFYRSESGALTIYVVMLGISIPASRSMVEPTPSSCSAC
jgi:hypothetical protein